MGSVLAAEIIRERVTKKLLSCCHLHECNLKCNHLLRHVRKLSKSIVTADKECSFVQYILI